MKSMYKFITIILIITMMASITTACRKKVIQEDVPQPPIVENPDVEQDKDQDKDQDQQEEQPEDPKENENQEDDQVEDAPKVITLENELGKEVAIEQSKDKLLVMTFWVDWNQQGKEQLKVLENLYPLLKDDVGFMGIHALGFDSISKEEAQEKIKVEGYSYPMLIDEESEAQQKYYVGSFPTTVIIDQEGNLVKSLTSVVEEDELLEEIEAILQKFLP